MDCFSDPLTHTIVLKWASQVGKTEVILNAIGWVADVDPGPSLLVLPDEDTAKKFSSKRIEPMIRDTPKLLEIFGDQKKKSGGSTILEKPFTGGHLLIGSAGKPADLASFPMRYLFVDETDRNRKSSGTEGSATSLAEKRQRNYWNRTKIFSSSPGEKDESEIDDKYQGSDKRMYHVPCPHCGEKQTLEWSQVQWDKEEDENGKVKLNEFNKTLKHFPETTIYICKHQGCLWTEADRRKAVKKGEWRASEPFRGIAGFHLNVLYSPFVTLAEIVEEFIEADQSGDFEKLKTFINTALAQVFEHAGSSLDADPLFKRKENYGPETIPERALYLTVGVDMQGDRLEVTVGGWGPGEENWIVEYLVLMGSPGDDEVWEELDKTLSTRRYVNENGRLMRISAACIDTGGNEGNPERAHRFCKNKWKTRKVFPIKGRDGSGPLWPLSASPSKVDKGQYKVWMLHVDTGKISLYDRLAKPDPGPGYVHFCENLPEAYFKGLTVEKKVKKYKNGRPYFVWDCPKGKRNEPLDTWNYHYAALKSLNVRWPTPEEMDALMVMQRHVHSKTTSSVAPDEEMADVAIEVAQAKKVLAPKKRRKRRGQSSKSSMMR